MESAEKIYGRLSEAVKISGYCLEQAIWEFEYLLEENRWKEVGEGFEDIDLFLNSLKLDEFKIAVEKRKKIAQKLSELKASQIATANILGVNQSTISRDINKNYANALNEENINIENEIITNKNYANALNEEMPGFIDSGQKEVVQKKRNEEKQKEKEKEREEKAKQNKKIKILNPLIDFRLGDFRDNDIEDNSIDLILTDPPYPQEFLPLWGDLAIEAKRLLKPNGFLIAYSGQLNFNKVIQLLDKHLTYYWTFALIHTGTKQLIQPRNIFCGWKPLLIYQNGFKKIELSFNDIITGTGIEKDYHKWQQSELELKNIIEHFTKPGDLIFEPFTGSGTIILATSKLNRNIIAYEIDETTYNLAKGRITGNS